MAEYIDRTSLINNLKTFAPEHYTALINDLILKEPAANVVERKKGKWISVTERLPEDGSDVLAYLKYANNSRIAAANYYKGTWQDCVMGRLYLTEEGFVTHWMPLPEPPKEE